MTLTGIMAAQENAKRLIQVAETVLRENQDKGGMICSSKHTGELRRASMDLTRELARMRNPWRDD